jgi:hypothetical protein
MTWGADASPYEILEVSPNASRDEIDASYRRIIGFLEPDNLVTYAMLDDAEVVQVRLQVDRAYQLLCQADRRAAIEASVVPANAPDPEGEADDLPPAHLYSIPEVGSVPQASPMASGDYGLPRRSSESPSVLFQRGESDITPPPLPQAVPRRSLNGSRRRTLKPRVSEIAEDTEFSGALLRRLRESAEASLNDLSEITKISKRYLHALEENDFNTLPAGVYVRGFISEYARALGLDCAKVAESYMGLYRRYRGESA